MRRVTSLALSLLALRPVAAQRDRVLGQPPEFALDQWTTQHGLPQNSVTAIAQTPDGYLWVGTFGGLARFDGTSFMLQERVDSSGRHVDRIRALAVARDSALWIGTENGLLRYRNGAYRVYTTVDGLPEDDVRSLLVDRTGVLWIATERGRIARVVDGRVHPLPPIEDVRLDESVQIREDRNGTLWINGADRFVTVERGDPTTMARRPFPAAGIASLVLHDRAGAYWFSQPGGVVRIAGGAVRRYGRPDGVTTASVMIEGPGGGYWLGTFLDGLTFFDPGRTEEQVRRYPLPDGRTNYGVRSAYVDLDGNVWFGTDADGLLRAKRNLFTTYTRAHGLSHDVATAVYTDHTGTVWVGTNCFGVNAIDPVRNRIRVFKPRRSGDPEGDPCVFALTESPAGTMWAGTWGGGLTRLVGGREERLKQVGLRDSVILALFTDRDGTVWVGTNRGGVAALEGGRVRATYTTSDGLAHNSVRTFYQTRDGALWIGTLEGMSRFAGGRFTTYTAADGLSASHVRAIHEDAAGDLWIGTYGGGLNRLRDGVFASITRQDGLADDVVSAIVEDRRGNFWMSGNRGIYRVARNELIRFIEKRIPRVHSVLYGSADGLHNAETNGGFQPSATRDDRGRLWFPTVQGIAVVDPAQVPAPERPPTVAIDEVVVDGVARPPARAVEVGPGRPNLEFRYTGLSLSAPEHLTFRYRLEGFDPDWVEAGTRRVAYYPRLPPGKYRFVVTAANRDGVWNPNGAGLQLRAVAPFWQAAWFRLVAVLGLVGAAVVVVRHRERLARRRRAAQEAFSRALIESQEHERQRLAGELHDQLGQDLLVVKNRALIALGADGLHRSAREQLEHISLVASQALNNVRGMAHHLSPYQLDHLGLSSSLRTMIASVAGTTEIAFTAAVEDIDGLLPRDGEVNLYRIVQEALSNVVRHSGATAAELRVRRTADAIVVTIADDGRGFPIRRDGRGRPAGGFGLTGLSERARILGGRADIASAPGHGTRVELTVPIAPTGEKPA